jgi:hemerythrin-like domain-containing protein
MSALRRQPVPAATPVSDTLFSPAPEELTSMIELRCQHRSLAALLRSVEMAVSRCSVNPDLERAVAAVELLSDFETALVAHFEFEEAGGYLSDALEAAPRLSRQAARIFSEHGALRRSFADLASRARRADSDGWPSIAQRLSAFGDAMRGHETEENRLLNDALLDDLGGG